MATNGHAFDFAGTNYSHDRTSLKSVIYLAPDFICETVVLPSNHRDYTVGPRLVENYYFRASERSSHHLAGCRQVSMDVSP